MLAEMGSPEDIDVGYDQNITGIWRTLVENAPHNQSMVNDFATAITFAPFSEIYRNVRKCNVARTHHCRTRLWHF